MSLEVMEGRVMLSTVPKGLALSPALVASASSPVTPHATSTKTVACVPVVILRTSGVPSGVGNGQPLATKGVSGLHAGTAGPVVGIVEFTSPSGPGKAAPGANNILVIFGPGIGSAVAGPGHNGGTGLPGPGVGPTNVGLGQILGAAGSSLGTDFFGGINVFNPQVGSLGVQAHLPGYGVDSEDWGCVSNWVQNGAAAGGGVGLITGRLSGGTSQAGNGAGIGAAASGAGSLIIGLIVCSRDGSQHSPQSTGSQGGSSQAQHPTGGTTDPGQARGLGGGQTSSYTDPSTNMHSETQSGTNEGGGVWTVSNATDGNGNNQETIFSTDGKGNSTDTTVISNSDGSWSMSITTTNSDGTSTNTTETCDKDGNCTATSTTSEPSGNDNNGNGGSHNPDGSMPADDDLTGGGSGPPKPNEMPDPEGDDPGTPRSSQGAGSALSVARAFSTTTAHATGAGTSVRAQRGV
jgi:hypothetical protein